MFLKIGLVLFILWIAGFSIFHVTGFLIHILLVAAIVSVLLRIIRGK